jgi:M6 family metalloprotease-like protein
MNNRGNNALCPTGSVWNVYNASSYGQLDLQSVVTPWVTVPNTEAYYANGDRGITSRTHDLIRDALNLVDSSIDFRDFNKDGDSLSRIDAITFLHSGYGAEFGGTDAYGAASINRIWSHQWSLSTGQWVSGEGVSVYDYHISPAVWGTTGNAIGRIGVIAHELGESRDCDLAFRSSQSAKNVLIPTLSLGQVTSLAFPTCTMVV